MKSSLPRIVIGSDHAGFKHKETLVKHLMKKGWGVVDVGPSTDTVPVDYPLYAKKVCSLVLKDSIPGILICGSGTGMAMAANKIKGIRAAMCYDSYSATMAKKDNNANVLTLRGRNMSQSNNKKIVDVWLSTAFSELDRHKRRIQQLNRM